MNGRFKPITAVAVVFFVVAALAPLFVASKEAIEARRRELKELLEVEIPKTLKGITAAAAEEHLVADAAQEGHVAEHLGGQQLTLLVDVARAGDEDLQVRHFGQNRGQGLDEPINLRPLSAEESLLVGL